MENKSELNEKIAKVLGFKKIMPNPKNGIDFIQWTYPDNWKDEVTASPITTIPDFIMLMEKGRSIAKMFEYGIPTEFFND